MAGGGHSDQTALSIGPLAAGAGVLALFARTLLLSALLLFWLQPMFARMVLPRLGGSPAVWNTAMVFFQTALLAGYAYAHAIGTLARAAAADAAPSRPAGARRAEPAGRRRRGLAAAGRGLRRSLWLIGLLAGRSACRSSPSRRARRLLQLWFAGSGHRPAGDPYFLYGASNLGSLAALLGYPLLLEPTLDLAAAEPRPGALGYGALVAAGRRLRRWSPGGGGDGARRLRYPSRAPRDRLAPRLRWLALAAVPSALLLAVTAHVTTDLAAVPLLWVIPLAPLSLDLRPDLRPPTRGCATAGWSRRSPSW